MNKILSKLTILVLAHENHFYLSRCIEYLETFKLNAIILDSSTEFYHKKISSSIEYVHISNGSYFEKVFQGLQRCSTEYSALMGVDDFYFPKGLKMACQYLDNNKDYISVAGDVISVNQSEYANNVKYYPECEISHGLNYDASELVERLKQFERFHYPPIYTMQRCGKALKLWWFLCECERGAVINLHDKAQFHFVELIVYLATLMLGKHANLKCTFWMRDAFSYSASGDIEHFNYDEFKKHSPDVFSRLYRIASDVFQLDYLQVSTAFDEALIKLSSQVHWQGATSSANIFQYLKNDDFSDFIKLSTIIDKHQKDIIEGLTEKFGKIPRFYHKYGENWAQKMQEVLAEKLEYVASSIVIYGAGEHTEALFCIYDFSNQVAAICDSNSLLWGKSISGIPIIAPYDILKFSKTVLISSMNSEAEINQFIKNGFGQSINVITLY